MPREYTRNHYVPQWYQKRFIPTNQVNKELYLLNLSPTFYVDPERIALRGRSVKKQGVKHCFAQDDLYTIKLAGVRHTDIERHFFGEIDEKGKTAVEFFADYDHLKPDWDKDKPLQMLEYMSTQKLRTPKGLGWLADKVNNQDHNQILQYMLGLKEAYCAIWAECIWQIADSDKSTTKFIISDHPVTVYNRSCNPSSGECQGNNDPDINLQATHTIFPLSLEKILILTNLSWVINPYQSEMNHRPNPRLGRRPNVFSFLKIQTLRHLNEHEVREINLIIKSRAQRYIAAANEEWLYPETQVPVSGWGGYGCGWLLMPDPRAIMGIPGETIFVGDNNSISAFDKYGRRPWEHGYNDDSILDEADSLERFKGEFAKKFGPQRRGRAFDGCLLDPERDCDEVHQLNLDILKRSTKS